MKKLIIIPIIILLSVIIGTQFTYAMSNTRVSLSDYEITVNGEKIGTDTSSSIYMSSKMNNGGTSSDAISSNVEIDNIININAAGTYEFSGTLSDGQISINANNISSDVRIILNNANITCENAPAIFVYSKNVENEECKVTIESKSGTINNISGGKIKQSVEDWEDQDNILYYIDKGYDDDKQYYERYKYDGAISSDISLVFEGTETLNVSSSSKEGIESKMNITINEGTYNIQSLDDGINACTENKSIITINGGTVIVNILDEADEGDGIDSNGYLYINGGTVYAFAHPGSDNGLDSDLGTYINGGTVLSTGSMYEEFKTSNNTPIVQVNLSNEVSENESIVIVDENNNAVFAFKTDRKISTFAYSSSDLSNKTYSVYTGTSVEGTLDSNNIYTDVSSIDLDQMTKQENNNIGSKFDGNGIPDSDKRPDMNGNGETDNIISKDILPNTRVGTSILVILIIIIVSIIVFCIFGLCSNKRNN